MAGKEIILYAPLEVQQRALDGAGRFKLWRAGRRGSKSRGALYAATVGHGPEVDGRPLWKGMAQGAPILWLAPDYPQARAIWREEILQRFDGAAGVTINKEERRVELAGGGSLELRSFENVDSIRGRKYGGFIGDESAYYDLQYAWDEVVRPALADLRGWAIFPSTPNFGKDGNPERPHGPSYFNQLCEMEMEGKLGTEWEQYHWTTRDNPKIDREEIQAIYAEYEHRPFARDQELDAKLLSGVEGVFFREFRKDVHVRKVRVPDYGVWYGAGMDWGYSSPGWIGVEAFWQGPHGPRKHLLWEYEFQKLAPYDAGYRVGKGMMSQPRPEFIAADLSMWDTGDGRGGVVVPVAEEFQRGLNDALGEHRAPRLFPAPKGKQSREVRALAMREALKHTANADGVIPPWGEPMLTIDPSCGHFIRCLEVLPTDPSNPELPATEGVYDHPYDGETYLAVIRKPEQEKPKAQTHPDRSYSTQKFSIRMEDDHDDGRRRERRDRRGRDAA